MKQQLITFAVAPQELRLHIFDNKIAILLFWVTSENEPIIFVNPNITEFSQNLKDGIINESGTVSLSGGMSSVQLSVGKPTQEVILLETSLKFTLQNTRQIGEYNFEFDILVEE